MKTLISLSCLLFALTSSAQPLFKCTPTLEDAYGVCSHITRASADYPIRDKDLERMREVQIDWVRSDFDWYTAMKDNDRRFDPEVFDQVLASCKNKEIRFLPILDRGYRNKLAWEDTESYLKYVHHLVSHYKGRISHWEIINEANLIGATPKADLGHQYAKALKATYQELKRTDPQALVVYGGQGEVWDGFLEAACDSGAFRYFDIMNFHSYNAPEELIESFQHISDVMKKYNWNKPVWLTETGYTTPPNAQNHRDFFTKVVPEALSRIGKEVAKCTVGIVYDPQTHLLSPTEEQLDYFKGFKSIQVVSLRDLETLNPEKTPLLLPSYGEYFPEEYMESLVQYVQQGGTLICPSGVPFYFDHWENGRYVHHGGDHQAKLHLSFLYWWDEEAKRLQAPEVPEWSQAANGMPFDYHWTFDKTHSSRYLTDRNLQPGDSMIPLVEAGDKHFKGCVAALYKLQSDLSGNLIVQTRMDNDTRNEAVQAKRLARAFLLSFAYGIDKVFWYHLRAFERSEIDPESHFGILHSDFSPKPAFAAYKTLTKMCPNGSTRPKIHENQSLYQATWQRPDGTYVAAIWTTGYKRQVAYKINKCTAVTSHLGEAILPKKGNLSIGNGVIYVTSDRKIPDLFGI